jgi:hypothetical protein
VFARLNIQLITTIMKRLLTTEEMDDVQRTVMTTVQVEVSGGEPSEVEVS